MRSARAVGHHGVPRDRRAHDAPGAGAILIGMGATAAVGYVIGLASAPAAAIAMPSTGDYSLAPIALHLDIAGVLRLSFLPVLLTLVLMSFLPVHAVVLQGAEAGADGSGEQLGHEAAYVGSGVGPLVDRGLHLAPVDQ